MFVWQKNYKGHWENTFYFLFLQKNILYIVHVLRNLRCISLCDLYARITLMMRSMVHATLLYTNIYYTVDFDLVAGKPNNPELAE